MLILPAIDIKDNNCVRLYKGDYSTVEKVADDCIDTALSFKKAGAEWIHMVDLDGAKDGSQQNKNVFLDVAQNTGLKVELGGGIRSLDTVEMYLSGGISRVILGSAAVKNPNLVKQAVNEFGERIAVGIDAKNEYVATEGWLESSDVHYVDLAVKMCEYNVKYFILTDIEKDGTLNRPNFEMTERLQKKIVPLGGNVIASGGIKDIDDIIKLTQMGVYAAICGKSIYNKSLDLEEAIQMGGNINVG